MQIKSMIPDPARLLAGTENPTSEAWEPFAPEAVDFLDSFSKALRADARVKMDPEAMALAFWCRRARLEALRKRHGAGENAEKGTKNISAERHSGEINRPHSTAAPARLGRGLLFHLAPANVPMMFAYTWAIGLLAGNAGIVRISERTLRLEAVQAVLRVLGSMLGREEYEEIRSRISLISYEHSDAVTEEILSHCDGRVLWGGDETIRQMRRIPMPAHAVELAFPDRVSLAVISEAQLKKMNDDQLRNLVHRFYNDTYVMDQNGCSSPQTVIWLRESGSDHVEKACLEQHTKGNAARAEGTVSMSEDGTGAGTGTRGKPVDAADAGGKDIREKWWDLLAQEADAEYETDGFRAARKLEKAAVAAMREDPQAPQPQHVQVTAIRRYHGNALYVLRLSTLPPDLAEYKGGFGLFYETEAETAGDIFGSFSDRIQTIVCVGIRPGEMGAAAARAHSAGALRFVETGQALQMDTVWDGTDLIEALSRRIVM